MGELEFSSSETSARWAYSKNLNTDNTKQAFNTRFLPIISLKNYLLNYLFILFVLSALA